MALAATELAEPWCEPARIPADMVDIPPSA
jgi:hypothetical protein